MSDRQASFIDSLMNERELSGLTPDQRKFLAGGTWRLCDSAAASRIIEALLEQPRKAPRSVTPVTSGRYAVTIGGALRFFKVDRPTDGRWAGRLFLSETIGGRDRGRSIREPGEVRSVLDAISVGEMAARVRYGREIGACGYCNRTLTDETSRICGIGPDCARQHDVDRDEIVASLLDEAS